MEFTEPALADADTAYLNISASLGPDYAILWYEGLFEAAQALSSMPYANSLAPENDNYGVEVRRVIYFGPRGKTRRNAYRILYFIIEPSADDDIGVVRILHIWHGARNPGV